MDRTVVHCEEKPRYDSYEQLSTLADSEAMGSLPSTREIARNSGQQILPALNSEVSFNTYALNTFSRNPVPKLVHVAMSHELT